MSVRSGTPVPSSKPVVLIVGATGRVGRFLVDALDAEPGEVVVRLAARTADQVAALRARGHQAVWLDLDQPWSLAPALAGVDRVFLVTGYSVAMVAHSKTLVDAAVKAGVTHVVNLGVFGNWDCTDPHFAWHQMIDRYLETSGVAWTHLHPNVFMDLLSSIRPPVDGVFSTFWGDHKVGWVAAHDIAAVAAAVLREGPSRHGGKDYWLSTEVASGPEVAAILTASLGREFRCEAYGPAELAAAYASGGVAVERWYAAGTVQFSRQVLDGRMGYIGTVRDDVSVVTGRPALTLSQWAVQNREQLLGAAPAH
jgi:NAD(P)H dehydrogenase (quinone)